MKKRNFIPSRKQWKNWSLPSKSGIRIGIAGILFTLMIADFPSLQNKYITFKTERIEKRLDIHSKERNLPKFQASLNELESIDKNNAYYFYKGLYVELDNQIIKIENSDFYFAQIDKSSPYYLESVIVKVASYRERKQVDKLLTLIKEMEDNNIRTGEYYYALLTYSKFDSFVSTISILEKFKESYDFMFADNFKANYVGENYRFEEEAYAKHLYIYYYLNTVSYNEDNINNIQCIKRLNSAFEKKDIDLLLTGAYLLNIIIPREGLEKEFGMIEQIALSA